MLQVQCTVLALQLFQNRRKLLSLFFRISTSKFGADLPKIKGDILSVCDNPVRTYLLSCKNLLNLDNIFKNRGILHRKFLSLLHL